MEQKRRIRTYGGYFEAFMESLTEKEQDKQYAAYAWVAYYFANFRKTRDIKSNILDSALHYAGISSDPEALGYALTGDTSEECFFIFLDKRTGHRIGLPAEFAAECDRLWAAGGGGAIKKPSP